MKKTCRIIALNKHVFFSFLFFLISYPIFAQTGTITGNVIDAETAEELIGVTVQIAGTSQGAVTDLGGNYQLQLEPGTYTLKISYVSYAAQVIENVEVKMGEAVRIDAALKTEDVQLQEIVIQAAQINNNEVALLKLQQKALAVQDGISISEIRRLGASNSAESMKQVTGASVEGGKYVVMRGLGDRYSLTQMNGITLPSTNPYRNSVSMDLIPTTIIENIVTTKTFTPDQPGNFTGGNINISTRSIPEDFFLSARLSVGYNTEASLSDEFLTDPLKGDLDWLGYDNGTRELPAFYENEADREALRDNAIASRAGRAGEQYAEDRRILNGGAKAFAGRTFIPTTKTAGLNNRFQLSFGDRKTFFGKDLGYSVGFNYGRSFLNYKDRQLNVWALPGSNTEDNLIPLLRTDGIESIENASVGAFGMLSYQLNTTNELTLNYTYTNDAEKGGSYLSGIWPRAIAIGHTYEARGTTFLQRSLSNIRLSGKHVLSGLNRAKLDWTLAYIESTQNEPDTRLMGSNITTSGIYQIRQAEYDRPFHFFRDLEDQQYDAKLDLEIPLGDESQNQLRFGLFANRKDRDFTEQRYQHQEPGGTEFLSFREAAGDYDAYFAENNLGIIGQNSDGSYIVASYYSNETNPSNAYSGYEQVLAGYAMGVFKLSEKLKFVGGVRVEKTDFKVASGNPNDTVGVIDELDFLPSVNLIYAVNDQSNIRLSGSQTLARPNMREMAPFVSFDSHAGNLNSGNPNLKRSTIWNADLRYELFPKGGELIAVSGFFKKFKDPIQRRLIPAGSTGQIRYVNVDEGFLYGLELELRKDLGGFTPFLTNFQFTTNFTYTISRVDLTEEELGYLQIADPNPRDYRPFQAQSPFILNANLTYYNPEIGLESTIYANMYGERLYYNGFGGLPDVYEVLGDGDIPTPDLRFTINKSLWNGFNISFRAENLLDAVTYRFIDYRGTQYNTDSFRTGRTFTISVGYQIGQ